MDATKAPEGFPASSRRIVRALLMAEPASLEAGENTDKGYVNQHAVIAGRSDFVEELYAEKDANVLRF
jgi:feruloyl-CoA synthase